LSRGQKAMQPSSQSPAPPDGILALERLIEQMGSAEDLATVEDPLDVELLAAKFVQLGRPGGQEFADMLVGAVVLKLEAQASVGALAMLLAIGSVTEDQTREAALTAAGRLAAAGIRRPRWAAELEQPIMVSDCCQLIDPPRTGSMLACRFHRAGRSHAVVVNLGNPLDHNAANDIILFDGNYMSFVFVLEQIRAQVREQGVEITTEALDPVEFRRLVKNALNARATQDSNQSESAANEESAADDSADYHGRAVLLRTWMNAIPVSR
jgi:hypothetical protein